MQVLILLFAIYTTVFAYVIFWKIRDWYLKKEIEKNREGKFGGAVETDVLSQDKKTRDMLLGFSPPEALKFLTDVIVAITAITALYTSLDYH